MVEVSDLGIPHILLFLDQNPINQLPQTQYKVFHPWENLKKHVFHIFFPL